MTSLIIYAKSSSHTLRRLQASISIDCIILPLHIVVLVMGVFFIRSPYKCKRLLVHAGYAAPIRYLKYRTHCTHYNGHASFAAYATTPFFFDIESDLRCICAAESGGLLQITNAILFDRFVVHNLVYHQERLVTTVQ